MSSRRRRTMRKIHQGTAAVTGAMTAARDINQEVRKKSTNHLLESI